jgi:hypothetical protein
MSATNLSNGAYALPAMRLSSINIGLSLPQAANGRFMAGIPMCSSSDFGVRREKGGTLDFRAKSAGTLFAKSWAKMPFTSITC